MNLQKIAAVTIRYNKSLNPVHLEAFSMYGKSLFVLHNRISLNGGVLYMKVIALINDSRNSFYLLEFNNRMKHYMTPQMVLPFGLS